MPHVLVVEDDQRIAQLIRAYLEREGIQTSVTHNGREGLRLFGEERPDLVILDLMLPGLHGRDVCRAIRTHSAVPIIMLTALDDERDIVAGLDLGADDYITKPFKPAELMARVRAALRRSAGPGGVLQEINLGSLTVRPQERVARVRDHEVELRAREFDLLLALMQRPGVVLAREQLLRQVWGPDYDADSRTIDVHVNRLRSRLGGAGVEIETVRGVGYRLSAVEK